jgi:hypothetical protein
MDASIRFARANVRACGGLHGREQANAEFIAKYPHRTANGAAYQID